jgi:hypothetical protein
VSLSLQQQHRLLLLQLLVLLHLLSFTAGLKPLNGHIGPSSNCNIF